LVNYGSCVADCAVTRAVFGLVVGCVSPEDIKGCGNECADPGALIKLPGKSAAHAAPKKKNQTRLGVPRKNDRDWRRLRDNWDDLGYGDILSPANRKKIADGHTPIVDDDWIKAFPGDAPLKGEQIRMHHIGGYPITVPLPESRHLDAHMPGGFGRNPGGPGRSG
jgi:filamentous hemagglutinin